MTLPSSIEIISIREFQSKHSFSGGSYSGSYMAPTVAIQISNKDRKQVTLEVVLHKKNTQNVINETGSIWFTIPPLAVMEQEHVFHGELTSNNKPGVWRIVGCNIGGYFYAMEEILLSTANSATPKSSCFIATAVYQNSNHPTVEELRLFRDQILEQSTFGRHFIRWYDRFGPKIAYVIERIPLFRPAMKTLLIPTSYLLGLFGRMIHK